MKSELNTYNIDNPDGSSKVKYNENKTSYLNDNSGYIKENPVINQNEWDNSALETSNNFVERQETPSKISDAQGKDIIQSSINSSTATVTSAVGSGVGAVASTVAASVASAVIVVAVFISTLTINISLLMATMTSLVFQVELSGAQEEDFVDPIIAVLSGDDGTVIEQQLNIDNLVLTFEGLAPGTEYVIKIKNTEKVFVEKSYFTATEDTEKGRITAENTDSEVFVKVESVELLKNEHYTLSVKDEKGNAVFVKDATEQPAEYKFPLPNAQKLFFSLSVNGKVYALTQLEIAWETVIAPQYDFDNPVWTWADNYSSASVVFADILGGEPLTLNSTVSRTTTATCEQSGYNRYTATATFGGQTFSDVKEESVSALGHAYGEPVFEWTQNSNVGYTANATFTCLRDSSHTQTVDATVTDGNNGYTATVQFGGQVYTDILPALNLEKGSVYIRANDFRQGEYGEYTSFTSSEEKPYIISGVVEESNDNIINIYNNAYDGGYNGRAENFYIVFKNISIYAYDEVAIFLIKPQQDVNLYITITGQAFFESPMRPIFFIQGGEYEWNSTINIFVTDPNNMLFSGTSDGGLYEKDEGLTVNFYINGNQVDENGEEITPSEPIEIIESPTLNLSDGAIYIRPNDYKQGEGSAYNSFTSSEEKPYTISGSVEGCDCIINVDNRADAGATTQTADYYVVLETVSATADEGAKIFLIRTEENVNVYITLTGEVYFGTSGQSAIWIQNDGSSWDVVVNVYVSKSGGATLNCTDTYSSEGWLYSRDQSITVNFFIDGISVDEYGNPN